MENNLLSVQETAARLNAVSELQMKSQPLEGTPAEAYLRKERGIKGELVPDLCSLPQGTTFIYQDEWKTLNYPCLAAFGRGQNGRLSSVQLIRLTEEGKRALSSGGEKLNKIQYGVAKGSFVSLQEDSSQTRVFIAEGLETALSLKEAGIKGKIVASLGIHNISHYQGSEKEIVLCADNDEHKQYSQTHLIPEKAAHTFKAQDKLVSIIKPISPGDDFNDVLKKEGLHGVQEYLKPYLDPEKQRDRLEQRHDSPGLNTKLAGKDIDLGKEIGISSSSISSSPTGKQTSLEIIAEYIETKLRDIKAYKGTALSDQARKELKNYLELLQKNESLFDELKEHHKDLSRDLERMFKEQEKEHHLHIQRGRDFSL